MSLIILNTLENIYSKLNIKVLKIYLIFSNSFHSKVVTKTSLEQKKEHLVLLSHLDVLIVIKVNWKKYSNNSKDFNNNVMMFNKHRKVIRVIPIYNSSNLNKTRFVMINLNNKHNSNNKNNNNKVSNNISTKK